MDALQKVFDTIKGVLAIIEKFFKEIFHQDDAEDAEAAE